MIQSNQKRLTTNVDRLLPNGTRDRKETVNKSQIYVTTAGWKSSFAYERLIELLIQSLIEPDEVMILGGTYKTPIAEGLLDEDFVAQLKLQDTYNEDAFEREYKIDLYSLNIKNCGEVLRAA